MLNQFLPGLDQIKLQMIHRINPKLVNGVKTQKEEVLEWADYQELK